MNPKSPRESIPSDHPASSGGLPPDENPSVELVDIGRQIADSESRDAVMERYVDEAIAGDETELALDEIARAEAAEEGTDEAGPEIVGGP